MTAACRRILRRADASLAAARRGAGCRGRGRRGPAKLADDEIFSMRLVRRS
jgi:hypothetical protein